MKKQSIIKTCYGFTLVELLVVIAIIGIMSSMLLPSLMKSKSKTMQLSCLSNLKNVSTAIMSYSDDYNGYIPPDFIADYNIYPGAGGQARWGYFLIILRYLTAKEVFHCPVDFDASRKSYASNPTDAMFLNFSYGMRTSIGPWYRIHKENNTSSKILIGDSVYYMTAGGYNQWCHSSMLSKESIPTAEADRTFVLRHLKTANSLFADGHVEMLLPSKLRALGITGGRSGNYLPCQF